MPLVGNLSFLALAVSATACLRKEPVGSIPDLKHYFSFGASFTQTMFDENSTQPCISNPMGNPSKPQTFTGGRNYVSYLTQQYNSTLVYNYNFARSGATTTRSIVNTGADSTTFEEQVHDHFMPVYGGSDRIWNSNDTYFSFHFGINDITLPLTSANSPVPDPDTRIPAILDAYFTYVEDLYDAGARRFLMIDVPPQDRTPMVLGLKRSVQREFKILIKEFNEQLLNRTLGFAKTHEGVYTAYYDVQEFLSGVLNDPGKYRFPDASCIDTTGQKCVWFNNFHPGWRLDQLWSQRMVEAMNGLGYNGSEPVGGYYV